MESAMSIQRQPHLTPEEYLALERAAEYKSEYFAGEIFTMAGASERHVSIVANLMYIPLGHAGSHPASVLSVPCGASLRPAGCGQRWPADAAGEGSRWRGVGAGGLPAGRRQ